ncbi:MAG: biotin--[acetyl-CoA-carboxylase] ligase [Thermodesulfobacteriota bacterium]
MTPAGDLSREPLTPEALGPFLETAVFGRGLIETHRVIDSTNRRARELAGENAAEGALVLAETQTAGRGRFGRSWHSPPGKNLYFSLILRPALPLEKTPLLTLAAGLGAGEALGRTVGRRPDIKWPNDLLLDGLKIAGLLAESEGREKGAGFVVLGLGLNVNLGADELPVELAGRAGSLLMATGRTWDRAEVLAALLKGLEDEYLALEAGGEADMLARYRKRCLTLGRTVRVAQGREVIEGKALDVDPKGRLVVQIGPGGETTAVSAGEATITGAGY